MIKEREIMTETRRPDECSALTSTNVGRYNRRVMIRGGIALGAGLAMTGTLAHFALAAQQDTVSPNTSPIAGDATSAIIDAANVFLETLSDGEKSTGLFDWTNNDQKQRWSNFPPAVFDRQGLVWGDLSQETQEAWLAMMQATLSDEGYTRILAEWHADDALLAQEGNGGGFGSANYYIALIGAPSADDPWQWQFGGHHVTVNATIAGGNLALTPSFFGVQPATYTDENGNIVKPLGDIEDDALALVASFDGEQQSAAVLGNSPMDLVLGPGQDGKSLQAEGLPASDMTDDQKDAFLHLINHYTGLGNAAATVARMDEIEADFSNTYFVWYGPTSGENVAYWRVTGPTIVIEYAPQGSGRGGSGGTVDPEHVHGIYRDPTNDYGAKWTGITLAS
jgi:hypothetical protein